MIWDLLFCFLKQLQGAAQYFSNYFDVAIVLKGTTSNTKIKLLQ